MKIKTGDMVKVISGHYKGTVGEVKAVSPKTNKIIVEGVNLVKKSLKPTQQNPDGGIVEHEAPKGESSCQARRKGQRKGQESPRQQEDRKRDQGG